MVNWLLELTHGHDEKSVLLCAFWKEGWKSYKVQNFPV